MRMLRLTSGVTRPVRVRNKYVRCSLGITDIRQKLVVVRAMTVDGNTKRGRPKNTWDWTIKKNLEKLSIME